VCWRVSVRKARVELKTVAHPTKLELGIQYKQQQGTTKVLPSRKYSLLMHAMTNTHARARASNTNRRNAAAATTIPVFFALSKWAQSTPPCPIPSDINLKTYLPPRGAAPQSILSCTSSSLYISSLDTRRDVPQVPCLLARSLSSDIRSCRDPSTAALSGHSSCGDGGSRRRH